MSLLFDWDPSKARTNAAKHSVTFDEARTVFADRLSTTVQDPLHSASDDERFVTIGRTAQQRTIVVVHSDRGGQIRIISARLATRTERAVYEEGS